MRFLILLTFTLPVLCNAQITLNSTDFSNANDTVRLSSTTDFAIDYASTGANFSWDFTSLIAESQKLLDCQDISAASSLSQFLFGNFSPTQYQASYFLPSDALPLDQIGQFLPVNISNIFQFTRVTPDSISSIGFSLEVDGNEIPFRSDTIEKRYQLPLNYGDAYTGKGYTEMDLNPFANIIWRQSRSRSSEVDGWGTIELPMGSFDVLRVRHTILENDSVYQEFFGNPMWVGFDLPTGYIYEWIAAGEKEPMLRIGTSEVGGNEQVTSVEYRDTYDPLLASIEEHEFSTTEVYPNPASSQIQVKNQTIGTHYFVVDAAGRNVLDGLLTSETISVESLKPGTYILVLKSNLGWSKAPFIKE